MLYFIFIVSLFQLVFLIKILSSELIDSQVVADILLIIKLAS